MAKFTLLEEALIEERRLQLTQYAIDRNTKGSDIVKCLLPNFTIFPKAVRLFDTRARIKKVHGGVGGGKTVHEVADDVKTSWFNKPYPHLIFSPTQDNANATVGLILEDLLRKNFIKFKRYKADGLYVVFFGKSESDAAHIYNWGVQNMIKGVTGASGSFNEAYSQNRTAVLVAEERIRQEAENLWYSKLFAGTCEPNVMDWGHEDYEAPDCDTEELLKITLRTRDNPFLTEKYIQDLYNKYTPEERLVYLDGIYTSLATGKVYTLFERLKHVKIITDYLKKLQESNHVRTIILSFDFNVNPMTAVELELLGKIRRQTGEYKLTRSHTVEMCRFIIASMKMKYPGIEGENRNNYSIIITGDATGKREQTSSGGNSDIGLIAEEFMKSGFNYTMAFQPVNPLVRDRVNYTEKLLEMGYYEIDPSCKHTIKDTELLCWKEGATGFVIDKSKSGLSHFSDARDYGLWITQRMGIDEGYGVNSGSSSTSFMDPRRN